MSCNDHYLYTYHSKLQIYDLFALLLLTVLFLLVQKYLYSYFHYKLLRVKHVYVRYFEHFSYGKSSEIWQIFFRNVVWKLFVCMSIFHLSIYVAEQFLSPKKIFSGSLLDSSLWFFRFFCRSKDKKSPPWRKLLGVKLCLTTAWYLYQMVTQNMLLTNEGKQDFSEL